MSKRKHSDISRGSPSYSTSLSDKGSGIQRQQLNGILDNGKTALFRSLKVARGFERQKLGRRQKIAKSENNEKDIARLDAEVVALKDLNLGTTAEIHLYKTLLKIKTIASVPSFPDNVQNVVEKSKKQLDPANANVQARLFKSGPVQEALENCLKDISRILGIGEVREPKKKRLRAKDYANGVVGNDTNAHARKNITQPPPQARSNKDEWSGLSDPEDADKEQDDLDPSAASNTEDDEYDLYASRLAASSDADLDSDSADRDSLAINPTTAKLNPSSITPSPAPSPSPSLSRSSSPPHKAPHKDPSTAAKLPRPKPKSTTFLPSLSQSAYFSGSDSSAASDAEDVAPKRKNRRGQQARRAIWEQKFGREARHIKLGMVDGKGGSVGKGKGRDEGWDPRKGAVGPGGKGKAAGRGWDRDKGRDNREDGGQALGKGRKGGRGPTSSGANSEVVGDRRLGKGKPAKSGDEGKLHPSWEAARKAKEMKKAVPFQGKKVVF